MPTPPRPTSRSITKRPPSTSCCRASVPTLIEPTALPSGFGSPCVAAHLLVGAGALGRVDGVRRAVSVFLSLADHENLKGDRARPLRTNEAFALEKLPH